MPEDPGPPTTPTALPTTARPTTGGRAAGPVLRAGALGMLVAGISAVYLPGTFTPDSLDICNQAFTDRYHDWHTPVLAWLWGQFDLRPGYLLVGVVSTFVAGTYLVLAGRLRPWVAVIATWVIALFPTTIGWLGTHSKDPWFAAAFLASLAGLLLATRARSPWQRRTALVVGLAMAWLAVASRLNAFIPVGAMLLFALPVPPTWPARRLARAGVRVGLTVLVLAACVGSQMLLNRLVIHPEHKFAEQATYQFDLAAMSLRTGEILFPEGTLRPGATLAEIDAAFDVGNGDAWFFGPGTPLVYPLTTEAQVDTLRSAWREAITDHPVDFIRHRADYAGKLVGLTGPHFEGDLSVPNHRSADWGLACPDGERDNPALYEPVFDALSGLDRTHLVRGWVFLVLLLVGGLVAGIRRPEVASLVTGGLLNEATYALGGMSPTFRYTWFTAICALLVCSLALARVPHLGRDLPPTEPPGAGSPDAPAPEGEEDRPDPTAGPAGSGVAAGVGPDPGTTLG